MDAEPSLFKIIKVARDEDLEEQIGRDIYFDLVDHDKVRNFRIQKQTPFAAFKEEVAKEFGMPVQFLRFWIWAKRQNHTYRPNRPLTPQEETQTVGQLREASNKTHNADLKLFLEVELGPDLHPIAPPDKTKEDILLFFKFYDPEKGDLRYVGRFFVKSSSKPIEILGKLNQMAGFAPDEEIELYEEIKFEPCVMCEHLDKGTSFRSSQIVDGDIICFQKSPPQECEEDCRHPDVPSFLEYVHNGQMVHFRSLDKPKEDDFCLELSKLHTYDDVVERLANQIGLDDPSKIRLTSHNCYSQQPKPQPIKYRGVDHLSDMLVHYNQTSDILYYEVLDIPLPELQGLKNLKVAFHHAMKDEVVIHNIRLPKQSTVGDVINELKTKVELSHSNAELRLLEVFYHKIYKIFPPNEKIENINDQYWTLRAEEIPEEEKNLGHRLIHVYHFNKDSAQTQMQVQNFGEPFFLVIHEGETLGEVKVRIQKKLQVPDEEFAKWKFAFLSLGSPEYLKDSDIVFARFQRRDVYGDWEQYLGLEHSYTAPKRSYAANQMQGTPDTRAVSLTATSMSGKSSSTLLENLKNLLAGFSSTKGTEKSTSSSNMSESSLPPNPPSLQQHREVLKNYLASSLESIEQAKGFDEIQRITLLLLQHSTSSLERTILKDLASRLEAFKVIVPTTKSSTENVRAQLTFLSGKKADVGARLGQAREHCDFLEAKFRKDSEEEAEIEKLIVHLMKQKEGLRISKNSLALELEKFSEQVTKDVEEWKVISEESEEANNKWLQVRETLAQANLSWKLFKQNLEQCEKGA